MSIHHALTVIDGRIHQFIHSTFEIAQLDDTCAFSEGPVWNTAGYYVFSDIPRNSVFRIAPGEVKSLELAESGCTTAQDTNRLSEQIGSNGLAWQRDRLLICQHGNGAIGALGVNGLDTLVSSFQGKRFNSPNDLVADPAGRVFFSDPPYGLRDTRLDPTFAQKMAGVYLWQDGATRLITDAYQYPNGVCLSPDFTTLYCCSNKPTERFVLAFDAATCAPRGTFCEENGDGIKSDPFGNLWLCTREGILVVDKTGSRLGLIALPAIPSNCCWGGVGGCDLLITARQFIFHIPGLLKNT